MDTYALDIESCYSDEVTVTKLGIVNYAKHEFTDPFCIAILGDNGYEYCGPIEDADWPDNIGESTVVAHNAGFDAGILEHRFGIGEDWHWEDTAAMAAYLQAGRSLKSASFHLLGKDVSKDTRDKFRGMSRAQIEEKDLFGYSLLKEIEEYCMWDTKLCLELWQKHSHEWPENERELARLTWKWANRGIEVDLDLLKWSTEKIENVLEDARTSIPWADKGVLSETGRNNYVKDLLQITDNQLPSTWESGSREFLDWMKSWEHHEEFQALVANLKRYHKANVTLCKLRNIKERTHGTRMPYDSLYHGAPHTGRWSGGRDRKDEKGGVNVQNMPRDSFEGVNMRHVFVAPKGYKFIIADFSQIELVIINWVVRNTKFLELFRDGMDGYEAVAVSRGDYDPTMGPMKDVNPEMRRKLKGQNLGAQYGLSGPALGSILGDVAKGIELVEDFRATNNAITSLWGTLGGAMKQAVPNGYWEMPLPSGRVIRYFNLHLKEGKYGPQCWANVSMDKHVSPWWGGPLTNHLCQGTGKDVLGYALMNIKRAILDYLKGTGLRVVWTVHDEIISEAPDSEVQALAPKVSEIMCQSPPWAPDLPLRAEPIISDRYVK